MVRAWLSQRSAFAVAVVLQLRDHLDFVEGGDEVVAVPTRAWADAMGVPLACKFLRALVELDMATEAPNGFVVNSVAVRLVCLVREHRATFAKAAADVAACVELREFAKSAEPDVKAVVMGFINASLQQAQLFTTTTTDATCEDPKLAALFSELGWWAPQGATTGVRVTLPDGQQRALASSATRLRAAAVTPADDDVEAWLDSLIAAVGMERQVSSWLTASDTPPDCILVAHDDPAHVRDVVNSLNISLAAGQVTAPALVWLSALTNDDEVRSIEADLALEVDLKLVHGVADLALRDCSTVLVVEADEIDPDLFLHLGSVGFFESTKAYRSTLFRKSAYAIRLATSNDIEALVKIEKVTRGAYHVGAEGIRQRLQTCPKGVVVLEESNEVRGVVFAQRTQSKRLANLPAYADLHRVSTATGDTMET